MSKATYDQVVAEIQQLPLSDKRRLSSLLAQQLAQQENLSALERIAQEQGVRPRSFAELLGPELDPNDGDDDVDSFVQELYEWRRGQTARSLD